MNGVPWGTYNEKNGFAWGWNKPYKWSYETPTYKWFFVAAVNLVRILRVGISEHEKKTKYTP